MSTLATDAPHVSRVISIVILIQQTWVYRTVNTDSAPSVAGVHISISALLQSDLLL